MFDRVMLSDVDGTLDYRCAGIGEDVIRSATAYVAAGGGLALATGRAIISTQDNAARLHVNVPSIVFGGSMLYDYTKLRCLWQCPLPQHVLQTARDIAAAFSDVAMMVYTDTNIAILNGTDMLWQKGIPVECDKRFLTTRVEGNILKLSLCGEHERVAQIRDIYFAGGEYEVAFSSRHFAEVVSPEAGKGRAMQVLAKLIGVPLERFIAMGDAQNDLEMLKLAGTAFTLANAPQSIQQVADVVLPHCQDQGAAQGFRRATAMLGTAAP